MELNEVNLKKIRGLILFTVVIVVAGINYRGLISLAVRLFGLVFPFLLGGALAFVINVPMKRIEKLSHMKETNKLRRPLCMVLTFVFVIGVLGLITFVVMPQLVDTVVSLQSSIPAFLAEAQKQAETFFAANPGIVEYIGSVQIDWKTFIEQVVGFLSSGASSVFNSTLTAAMSIVSGVTTFGIALIFSIYILLQKETLARQAKKLMKAFLPDKVNDYVLQIASLSYKTFSSFLTGQCVEAVILGTMFFITLTVLKLPYALLIGVLIAFTALIPVFGAFIGCAIGIFLMLMVNPMDALIFVVVFLVLQQIEGNLIYPYVVGGSVGLPSIWVLVAVTIGGSAMGVVGMLIFIPLCSVLYSILRGIVNGRLAARTVKPKKQGGKM